MARGINHVILVGRLTRDVEVRKTTSGVSVARFSVAVDRRMASSNQQGGQTQPSADFINCIAWRQSADFLGSYARKGSTISVDGSIQTGSYTNQQGQKVYTTEVLANEVQILDSRSSTQSQSSNMSYGMPEPVDPYAVNNNNDVNLNNDFNTGPSLDISSDDLPF